MSPNTARPGAFRNFAKSFKTPTVVAKPKDVSAYPRDVVDLDTDESPGPATPLAVVKPFRSGDTAISRFAYKNPVMTPKPEADKIHIGKGDKDRSGWGGSVHNPHADGAVVMPRPPEEWAKKQRVLSYCFLEWGADH
jgi:DNA repair and recombination protein RAD54B